MNLIKTLFFITVIISNFFCQKVINIWNGKAPFDNGEKAELSIYLPNSKNSNGRAIVMCPGGGYRLVSMDIEGTDWVQYFNQQGIAIFILRYRLPKGNRQVPISDAEEAIKIVRRNAKEWNINPKNVGIMGFSAGGHLASTIATHSKGDAKPDFHILFYPVITMNPSYTHRGSMINFLGEKPKRKLIEEYSNDLQVNSETSRVFLALCNDDITVPPINSINYYLQCNLHGVPASIHIYPSGGHGWGYRSSFVFHMEVLIELKNWLKSF